MLVGLWGLWVSVGSIRGPDVYIRPLRAPGAELWGPRAALSGGR